MTSEREQIARVIDLRTARNRLEDEYAIWIADEADGPMEVMLALGPYLEALGRSDRIGTHGEGYKICNNLIAFYSRLWSIDHKQFPNFFQRKAIKVKPADELFEARLAERRKWSE